MKSLEKISIVRYCISLFLTLFIFSGCALKTPTWYKQPQNPNEELFYCGYGFGESQMEAKTVGLDDLIQSVAIKINSLQQRKYTSGILNSSNYTRTINVENMLKELNDFHIKTLEVQRVYFNYYYFIQVCTPKESITNKLNAIIKEQFEYIDSNWELVNFQNKKSREDFIVQIENTLEKIRLLQVIQKSDAINYEYINKLQDMKQIFLEKRSLKIEVDDYYRGGIEGFLTQFEVNLNEKKFHYICDVNFETTYAPYKKSRSSLVKLKGTLKLTTISNKVLFSYTYTTIGEAKSNKSALQNAYKKWKEHIMGVKQFGGIFSTL